MEEERNYCVYMHIAPNGKKYVGITQQDPERRWQNGYGYADQKKFFNAIKKYGWDSFEHKILHSGLTKSNALNLESEYIKKYESVANGYNIMPDSKDAPGRIGKPIIQLSDDYDVINVYKSCRQASEKIGFAKSTILKYCRNGCKLNGCYWKQINDDIFNDKHYIAVLRIDNNMNIKYYSSVTMAAKDNNIKQPGMISEVCRKKTKTCGGYIWRYIGIKSEQKKSIAQIKKEQRLGETKHNNRGSLMKIIEYNNSNDVLVEFQDNYRYRKRTNYANFRRGTIRNPYFIKQKHKDVVEI